MAPSFSRPITFFVIAFVITFPLITVTQTLTKSEILGKNGVGATYSIAIDSEHLFLSIAICMVYCITATIIYARSLIKSRSSWQINLRLASLLSTLYLASISLFKLAKYREFNFQPIGLLIQVAILFSLTVGLNSMILRSPGRPKTKTKKIKHKKKYTLGKYSIVLLEKPISGPNNRYSSIAAFDFSKNLIWVAEKPSEHFDYFDMQVDEDENTVIGFSGSSIYTINLHEGQILDSKIAY